MMELIFCIMIAIGVLFQVLAIHWESWVFSILCIVWFLKLAVDSLNLQYIIVYQPVSVNNTLVNGSYNVIKYSDFGLNAIFLIFVFLNLGLAITYLSQSTFR